MSAAMANLIQVIPILLFLLLFGGAIFVEIQWLSRKGWATSGRATGFVFTTDLLGFGFGSFVVFVALMIMFMMVMGPAGRGSDIPESAYLATSLIAMIFPPLFLILSKRLFLLIFKIASGKAAWVYSLVSSILILLFVLIPPPLVVYLLWYLSTWK